MNLSNFLLLPNRGGSRENDLKDRGNMASSTDIFDERIQTFLKNCSNDSYLDIGIGEGKFGKMARIANKKARIVGVEISQPIIDSCDKGIYDEIKKMNVMDLIHSYPDFKVGMVMMGDVLEHLKKSDGIDFINYILYRCEYLLIKYPQMYLQFAEEGPYDGHVSMWFPEEFEKFKCPIKINETEEYMNLVVLQGFIGIAKANKKRYKTNYESVRII